MSSVKAMSRNRIKIPEARMGKTAVSFNSICQASIESGVNSSIDNSKDGTGLEMTNNKR